MATLLDVVTSRGKGAESTYRPPAGTICLVSGPNCDGDQGYVYGKMTILWCDDLFVLYRADDCWPNLNKWAHVRCKPLGAE